MKIRDFDLDASHVLPGSVTFDPSKPDGTPRKLLDVSRLAALGWQANPPPTAGIRLACEHFSSAGNSSP